MAGKGGGAWKVAYADFVTAMMAFFLVMWITAQSKEVKEAVAEHFQDPYHRSSKASGKSSKPPHTAAHNQLTLVANRESPSDDPSNPLTRKPRVLTLHDSQRTAVATVVVFAKGSAELDDTARRRLKQLLPTLAGKRHKIEIRGHASAHPLPPDGPFQTTWELCYARCLATMRYLEQEGIGPERIRLSQAGEFEPHTLRWEPDREAANSRVEVYMLAESVEDFVATPGERDQRFRRSPSH